jgi:hypothetical protein
MIRLTFRPLHPQGMNPYYTLEKRRRGGSQNQCERFGKRELLMSEPYVIELALNRAVVGLLAPRAKKHNGRLEWKSWPMEEVTTIYRISSYLAR